MVTVLRAKGLRVVISLNDHLPAHLRVLGDGEVKIKLLGADDMAELVWDDNASRSAVRRALRLVSAHQAALLQRWENIHGRPD